MQNNSTMMPFNKNYLTPAQALALNKNKADQYENKIIDGDFKIIRKIDEGAFGKIYKAVSNKTGTEVAIKFESLKAQHPQLILECKLYKMIYSGVNTTNLGFPRVLSCGMEDSYNYLVMDLMGDSLETLLTKNNKRFSMKTVLLLIQQMITLIRFFHEKHLLHRDIKPDNFCIGTGDKRHILHLLDLGLAKTYITKNGAHIPYKSGKNLTGTARYASVNTHNGIQQSRRDDMESIGYVALYCLKGSLPWQHYKSSNKFDKYQQIKRIKSQISLQQLCRGCPQQFKRYLYAVRHLNFQEKPKYDEYLQSFKQLYTKLGFLQDYQYDWTYNDNAQGLRRN